MSENMQTAPAIYSLMGKAMGEIGAIGKEKYNQQQKFNYRGVDDVMNALNPILVKHGLFVAPEVLSHQREERLSKQGGNLIYSIVTMRYTLYAPDGSSVSAVVMGEGMDSADKATNKAMSVAFKYAMFQLFCIPTEEMVDPDGESHGESQRKQPGSIPPQAQGNPAPPPQPKQNPFNAVAAIQQFCEKYGLTSDQFKVMRQGVSDKVQLVSYSVMTYEDYKALIAAIKITYGDVLKEQTASSL